LGQEPLDQPRQIAQVGYRVVHAGAHVNQSDAHFCIYPAAQDETGAVIGVKVVKVIVAG